MKCTYCGYPESKVLDSRPTEEGTVIRRRRECMSCQRRFTTYEKVETMPLMVIKRDGRRQLFDIEKVRNGIIKACKNARFQLMISTSWFRILSAVQATVPSTK